MSEVHERHGPQWLRDAVEVPPHDPRLLEPQETCDASGSASKSDELFGAGSAQKIETGHGLGKAPSGPCGDQEKAETCAHQQEPIYGLRGQKSPPFC